MASEKQASQIDQFRAQALECPLPQAVELIGEKWAFLILRGALNGLQHFEEFQAGLGIARNILSDRLGKMVCGGILERKPDQADRRKISYTLTEKGKALLPALVALRQWGEEWDAGPAGIVLVDKRDGQPVRKICLFAHDGRPLALEDLAWMERSDRAERPVKDSQAA